jgi:hypothetical protein
MSFSALHVKAETAHFQVLRARVLEEVPGIDDDTLSDTLEGITDLREMLAALVRSALEDEALVAGLSTRLSDMRVRTQRLTDRAEKKRSLVLGAMTEVDLKTLTEADFTACLRKGPPGLDVFSEERIPPDFWKPQPPKLDRQALIVALKGGNEIEGATLVPSATQLSVRTK